MREIKFRIWDKQKKKMIRSAYDLENFNMFISPFTGHIEFFERPKNVYKSPDADSIALVHWIKPYKIRENSDDLVLMQFTGLHDKNGKEIYEGDILQDYNYYDQKTNVHIVKFNEDMEQCMGGGHVSGFDFGLNFPEKSEIIGNIYQNPELLEEK